MYTHIHSHIHSHTYIQPTNGNHVLAFLVDEPAGRTQRGDFDMGKQISFADDETILPRANTQRQTDRQRERERERGRQREHDRKGVEVREEVQEEEKRAADTLQTYVTRACLQTQKPKEIAEKTG